MIPLLLLALFTTWTNWNPYPQLGKDYNITNMTSMVTYASTVTNSWFGIFVVIMIFVIMNIMVSRRYGISGAAFLVSAYVTFAFAVMLRIMSLVTDQVVMILIVIVIASTLGLTIYKRE